MTETLAFIGFGEAAGAFAGGIDRRGLARLAGFDLRDRSAPMRDRDVEPATGRGAALAGAGAVWCLVTADRALAAAQECARHLAPGTLWLDGNSCSPGTKHAAAQVIEAAGAQYVDVAIMAPVHPQGARVPLLVAGAGAQGAAALLASWGMNPAVAGDTVGAASTIKMLRSVMIKGLEALTAECVLAARRAGVEAAVLGSLQRSDPGFDWVARSAYNLERMAAHGTRRAAEMAEVARTLRELGLPDRMASATVDWQAQIGALGLALPDGLGERADALLAALPARE